MAEKSGKGKKSIKKLQEAVINCLCFADNIELPCLKLFDSFVKDKYKKVAKWTGLQIFVWRPNVWPTP